jgi:hypothetical protein
MMGLSIIIIGMVAALIALRAVYDRFSGSKNQKF